MWTYVPSHEDLVAHEDPVDQWILAHNQAVDRAAAEANLDRPEAFWDTYLLLCNEVQHQEQTQAAVVRFHVWLARTATRSQQPAVLGTPGPLRVVGSTPLRWISSEPCSSRAAQHLGAWFTVPLVAWLAKVSSGSDAEVRWISWVQLVTDFVMTTGLHPPIRKRGVWTDPRVGPGAALHGWNMTRASRSFAQQVRFVCRHSQVSVQTAETHPVSAAFALQLCSVWLPYPQARWRIVDHWLTQQFATVEAGRCHNRHRRTWTHVGRPPRDVELASL